MLSPRSSSASCIQVRPESPPPIGSQYRRTSSTAGGFSRSTAGTAAANGTPTSAAASVSGGGSTSGNGYDRPAALACTECRRKHVRCDATMPVCLRCASAGLTCHYLPSRRGLKRRADDLDGVAAAASMVALGSSRAHTTTAAHTTLPPYAPPLYYRRDNREQHDASQQLPSPSPVRDSHWGRAYGSMDGQVAGGSSDPSAPAGTTRRETARPQIVSTDNTPSPASSNEVLVAGAVDEEGLSPPAPLPPASSSRLQTAVPSPHADRRPYSYHTQPQPMPQQQQQQHGRSAPSDSFSTHNVVDDDALINLYYANFHSGHPILVPRAMYAAQCYPPYLRLVVHFIGSHFSTTTSRDAFRERVSRALAPARDDWEAEAAGSAAPRERTSSAHSLVQARLLFSVALHARGEIRESVAVLGQAVCLALDLGMHRRAYAAVHGRQDPWLEESLRRTWWELYVVDGFVAALQRNLTFRCRACQPDCALPLGDEPADVLDREAPTLEQFDARIFADDAAAFSSFCYRIDAVRILARALAASRGDREVQEEQLQGIDNALAAWRLNGPGAAAASTAVSGGRLRAAEAVSPGSATALGGFAGGGDAGGGSSSDEMLFQAHMLIQYTTLYLHFWRSDLAATVPAAFAIIRERHLPPLSTPRSTHGRRAVEASKQLVDLASLRVGSPHTPFFVFALVFGAIAQLSACCLHGADYRALYQDRLAVVSGVLKTLSPHWAFAEVVGKRFRRMAADLMLPGGGAGGSTGNSHSQAAASQAAATSSTSNNIGATGGTVYTSTGSLVDSVGHQPTHATGWAGRVDFSQEAVDLATPGGPSGEFPWMDLLSWDPVVQDL